MTAISVLTCDNGSAPAGAWNWSDRTNAKAIAEESMSAILAERGRM